MNYSTEMKEIIEERYQFCIWMYHIKKETDKRNKKKRKQGEINLVYMSIFALPSHIKKLFGGFLKTPQYTKINTLDGHTNHHVDCLTFHENKMYSGGGTYGNIRIWNTETYEEITTLRKDGHGGVNCLYAQAHENRLFSGGGDETIRIWNTETYELVATLRGHTNGVNCLCAQAHDNKLYSGSVDSTIRIWNTEAPYEEIATLRGNAHPVRCLTLHENKLFSGGAYDGSIRIWNTETYEEIATLRGHTGCVHCLCAQAHENKLFSGSDDKTIRIWNIDTYEEIAILRGHIGDVDCLCAQAHKNKLYSGSKGGVANHGNKLRDNIIRIWDTETYEEIATLEGHTEGVSCIAIHNNKLYSGSEDNTIRVWKI